MNTAQVMEMSRLQKLEELKSHPYYAKYLLKLSQSEMQFCIDFIEQHNARSRSEFEYLVNRVFIGKPDKPKNWTLICEILSCVS